MTRRFVSSVLISLFLLQAGCGSADAGQLNDSVGSASTTRQSSQPSTQATATSVASTATSSAQPQASGKGKPMDRTAIEQAVVADLAKYLKVAAKQITVSETSERTWPDQSLGCGVQRGLFEPVITPGYLIKLAHNGKSYDYHTDKQGKFRRCMPSKKPLGPITK